MYNVKNIRIKLSKNSALFSPTIKICFIADNETIHFTQIRLPYCYSSLHLYEILLYTYIKRRIPLDCRFPFTLLYPSYPIYIPCGINGLPLWYKIDPLANVLSWHILTSFSYSWTIMWYLFNMPANVNLNLYPALLSPTFLSHSNTGLFFSSIVKAYSLGTFICHTTDILSYCFF